MRVLALQAEIEFRLLVRQRDTLIFGLLIPVLLLFFVGVAYRAGVYKGYSTIGGLLPPYLVTAVMSIAIVNLGIAFAAQRASGVLRRLGGTPLPRLTLLAAKSVSSAVLVVLACLVLVLLAMLVYGVQLHGNLVAALLVVVIGTAGFCAMGVALGGTINAEGAAAITNGIYLPLLFLGGSFIPVDRMPDALRYLAELLPPAHLVSALNIILVEGKGLADTGWDLPIVALWGVAAAAVAARFLQWE